MNEPKTQHKSEQTSEQTTEQKAARTPARTTDRKTDRKTDRATDRATGAITVLQPPDWPRPKGYANGVSVRGRQVFVAGMVGWDAECRFAGDDFAQQARQALENIVAVLREGGAGPEHIVRMTWYVTNKREYLDAGREVGKAFREIIGSFNAAMTAVEVTALMEDEAKVEIEVTAVVPDSAD